MTAKRFGHSPATTAFWRGLVRKALAQTETPFFLFSTAPVEESLSELEFLQRKAPIPIRHWLSCKTQPVPHLLRWWRRRGLGVEVVSEFELLAALKEGFGPEHILVNGPAKQNWLPRYPIERLRVNFDSETEAAILLPLSRKQNWSLGVRCHTQAEFDPEAPEYPTQFGLQANQAVDLLRKLQRAQARVETIHFHLRTNLPTASIYDRALQETAEICRAARFRPLHLDCGGGIPPHHVLSRQGRKLDAQFHLNLLVPIYRRAIERFSGLQELWLENGRFLTARSGILVVRVLECKIRDNVRQLICDGGRTRHGLISTWEEHQILSLPVRSGPKQLTTICGPTCMAFDQLTRRQFPRSLQQGDRLIWMDAGAYQIPWETRFSHGLAAVLWHERGQVALIRRAESFESWWGSWLPV